MKPGTIVAALAVLASCSGGGESSSTTGVQTTSSAASSTNEVPVAPSEVPAVTQLSPEVLEELGPLDPPAAGGQSTGPLGSTVLDLDTGGGSVQIGDGEVPESMADLPAPDDLRIELASSTSEAAGFSGVSGQSVVVLADFFRDGLVEAGYRIVDDTAPTANTVVLRFEGDLGSGDVALSEAPAAAGTTVIVTFSPAR